MIDENNSESSKIKKPLTLGQMRIINDQQEQDDLEPQMEDIKLKSTTKIQPKSDLKLQENNSEILKQLQQKWGLSMDDINNAEEKHKEIEVSQDNNQKEIERLMNDRKNQKQSKYLQVTQEYQNRQLSKMKLQKKGDINKDKEYPHQYGYFVEERDDLAPKYNVGKEWAEIAEKQVQKNFDFRTNVQKNYLLAFAKRGKLGVDLYALAFGFFGCLILPIYFYRQQQIRTKPYRDHYKLIGEVKDWDKAPIDIDDISKQMNYNNMFTKEIEEERRKRIELQEEIKNLTNIVYAPKKQ